MYKKIVLVFLLAAIFSPRVSGQDYIIEILPTKKIIHVGKLGMPDYAAVSEALQILPEFATRGDELYSRFDIQYDGKSVGENRDATLFQTRLSEIEKIEISSSSVNTQQNSEYSGSINFVPKKIKPGVSGEIYLDASTEPDVMPGANINYANGKFQMSAFANFEGFWPETVKVFDLQLDGASSSWSETSREKYFGQTARFNFKYDFNGRDQLKGWFVESWKNSITSETSDYQEIVYQDWIYGPGMAHIENYSETKESQSKSMFLSAKCEYQHTFGPESKLKIFAGIDGNPAVGGSLRKSHTFNTQTQYDFPLLKNERHLLKMEAGLNTTLNNADGTVPFGSSTSVSPKLFIKYKGPKLSVEATARYNYFKRDIFYSDHEPYSRTENDFVADVNALWQICDHHALRLSASRNLTRPGDRMLYPGLVFNKDMNLWISGNQDLTPAYIHTAEIEFIYDWSGKNQVFVTNAKAGFIRADGLIEEVYHTFSDNGSNDKEPDYYVKYENSGSKNILNLMAGAVYKYDIMTLALTGNMFHLLSFGNTDQDRRTMFNISFSPIFNFQNDWMLSGRFIYNSPVNRATLKEGESYYASLRFGKKIGRWSLHIEFSDIFDTLTTDESIFDSSSRYYSIYDMYNRYIGIGCSFKI